MAQSLSPNSVLLTSKLDTILSRKEVTESKTPKQRVFEVLSSKNKVKSSNGRKSDESKSLSDLEFEELKGFMDLGFAFSEEDRNSILALVIPGLHRLGKKDGEEEAVDESTIPRPYLSDAWEVLDRRKREKPLINWRISALSNETDMEDTDCGLMLLLPLRDNDVNIAKVFLFFFFFFFFFFKFFIQICKFYRFSFLFSFLHIYKFQ